MDPRFPRGPSVIGLFLKYQAATRDMENDLLDLFEHALV